MTRRLLAHNDAEAELELELELERVLSQVDEALYFDTSIIDTLRDAWRSQPPDVRSQLTMMARQLWQTRGAALQQLVMTAAVILGRQPALPVLHSLQRAAPLVGLPATPPGPRPGRGPISEVQVQARRRRMAQRLPPRRRGRFPQQRYQRFQ